MNQMITEVALLALGIGQLIGLLWMGLWRRRQRLLFGELMKLSKLLVEHNKKQIKLNSVQDTINHQVMSNIEILGVHAKLIEPSVGLEAEAFLQQYNKRKGKDNG